MWKIIVVVHNTKLTYNVTHFTTRDGRILFTDRITGNKCNYPEDACFIEGAGEQ